MLETAICFYVLNLQNEDRVVITKRDWDCFFAGKCAEKISGARALIRMVGRMAIEGIEVYCLVHPQATEQTTRKQLNAIGARIPNLDTIPLAASLRKLHVERLEIVVRNRVELRGASASIASNAFKIQCFQIRHGLSVRPTDLADAQQGIECDGTVEL